MTEKQSDRYLIEQIIRTHIANNESENYIEILSPVQFTQETYLIDMNGNGTVDFLLAAPSHMFTHSFQNEQDIRNFNGRSPHHHDFYELLIVLDGEVRQEIEHTEFSFQKGSCCLMNRNISHKEMFHCPARILFIGLSQSLVWQLAEATKNSFSPHEEYPDQNSLLSFMLENNQQSNGKEYLDFMPTMTNESWLEVLNPLCQNLLNTIQKPFPGSTLILEGLLLHLMAYIGNDAYYHMSRIQVQSAPDYLLYCHICHLMEETNGRISRAELENQLHYSGNYINTIMKKYAGTNLSNYGMTICMKKAANLLTTTNLSIADIMASLQFTNTTHFYNCFRAVYKQTPGTYRIHEKKQSS